MPLPPVIFSHLKVSVCETTVKCFLLGAAVKVRTPSLPVMDKSPDSVIASVRVQFSVRVNTPLDAAQSHSGFVVAHMAVEGGKPFSTETNCLYSFAGQVSDSS